MTPDASASARRAIAPQRIEVTDRLEPEAAVDARGWSAQRGHDHTGLHAALAFWWPAL